MSELATFERSQEWYASNCDGDWEHQYGIKIDTLDNPGWSIRIDLAGTSHENIALRAVSVERSETEGLQYMVENQQFVGACGPKMLQNLIDAFFDMECVCWHRLRLMHPADSDVPCGQRGCHRRLVLSTELTRQSDVSLIVYRS
jgi:Immunity protein 53